jgi:hypothetical protein
MARQDSSENLPDWGQQMPLGIPMKGVMVEKCSDDVIDLLTRSYNVNASPTLINPVILANQKLMLRQSS